VVVASRPAAGSQLARQSAKSTGYVQRSVSDAAVAWLMALFAATLWRRTSSAMMVRLEAPTVFLHCGDDADENPSLLGTVSTALLVLCPFRRRRRASLAWTLAPVDGIGHFSAWWFRLSSLSSGRASLLFLSFLSFLK
jgi:hypothetical protein